MSENQKTAKGNVILGLVLGLVGAVAISLIAFYVMSKNSSPVQTDEFMSEQNADKKRLNGAFDPNDSLQSKVPIKSFNQQKSNQDLTLANDADADLESNNSNNSNNSKNTDVGNNTNVLPDTENSTNTESKTDSVKNKIVELFDEFGDKKLGLEAEDKPKPKPIDPDELAMLEAQNARKAQKIADEAKQEQLDKKERLAKIEKQKLEQARLKEIKQRDLEKKRLAEEAALEDPINQIVAQNNKSKTSNNTSNSGNSNSQSNERFYVQTGAFKNINQADQQKALLNMQGMQAAITEVDSNGQTLHRVRLGPFKSRQEVQKLERSLEQGNLSYKVIKVAD